MKNSFENTNSRKPSGPILPSPRDVGGSSPINDPRHESIKRAYKEIKKTITHYFKEPELTKSVGAWEFIFNVREDEGLFDILEKKGVTVIRNADGTVTIKK